MLENKKVACEQSAVCDLFFDKLFDNPGRELAKFVIYPLINVTTLFEGREYKACPKKKDNVNRVTSKDVREKIKAKLEVCFSFVFICFC